MTIAQRIRLLSCIIPLLSGCSLFSVQTGPTHTYILEKVPENIPLRANHHVILGVTIPSTSPVYNTTDMIYSTYPYQVASFAKNSWVATPPQMLQPLIVRTLQNTHYFAAVKTTVMGKSDYILNTELLELQQDFKRNPSVVRVRIRADIVRAATNQLVRSKEFDVVEPAPQNSPYGGVIAANQATAEALAQLAWFCVK